MKPPTGPPPGGYGYYAPAAPAPEKAPDTRARRGRRWWVLGSVLGIASAPILLATLGEDRAPAPIAIAPVATTPSSVQRAPSRELDVLAVRGDTVFVARASDRWIYAQPIAGGRRTLLARATEPVRAIAVDEGFVYVATGDETDGAVQRVPVRGGELETIASGLHVPMRVAARGDALFVTVSGFATWNPTGDGVLPNTGELLRIPLRGGPWKALTEGATDPVALAVGGGDDDVFFADRARRAIARAHAGSDPAAPYADMLGTPWEIAVGRDAVYWTERDEGRVWRAPLSDGESPKAVADAETRPSAIAVAGGTACWVDEISSDESQIVCAVPPGQPRVVGSYLGPVRSLVASGIRLMWSDQGIVRWMTAGTQPLPEIAHTIASPDDDRP